MSYYTKFPSVLMGGFHPYTRTYVAAITTPPSIARVGLYDKLVRGLVNNDIWDDLDLFYINANFDNQSSRLNLIDPSYATLTALGTAAFTVDQGWAGGASGANNLNNGVALNTLSKMSLNSAHLGIYSRDGAGTSQRFASSASSTAPFLTIVRNTATSINGFTNQGSSSPVTGTVVTTNGHIVTNRSGASAQELYKDGSLIGSNTTASTSVPTGALYAPGYINTSNASQFSILHAGSSLTSGKVAILNELINEYLTKVGAIP